MAPRRRGCGAVPGPSPAERSAAGDGPGTAPTRPRRLVADGEVRAHQRHHARAGVPHAGGDKGRTMVYRISAVETGTALVATATVFPSAAPRSVRGTYHG
jgi:hypothetical protein